MRKRVHAALHAKAVPPCTDLSLKGAERCPALPSAGTDLQLRAWSSRVPKAEGMPILTLQEEAVGASLASMLAEGKRCDDAKVRGPWGGDCVR